MATATRTDAADKPPAVQHEQREHPRLTLPAGYAQVRVRPDRRRSAALTGHCYDLSWGGLRFEIDEAIPVGEALDVELNLPGDTAHPVHFRAVCVRQTDADDVGPIRTAAAIVSHASDVDRRALADYLDRRLHRPRKAG